VHTHRAIHRNDAIDPNLPSKQVSTGSTARLGSDSGLPVRLIDEDGTEVTDDVDDTKHETISRDHGQVRSILVSRDRTASVRALFVESLSSIVVEVDSFALLLGEGGGLVKESVNLVTGIELDVHEENHRDQDGKDNNGVDVTGQESSLETTRCRVEGRAHDRKSQPACKYKLVSLSVIYLSPQCIALDPIQEHRVELCRTSTTDSPLLHKRVS